MSPRDKVGHAALNMINCAIDVSEQSIATAAQDGRVKLDSGQITFLKNLVKIAIETGYHRSYNVFMREVDGAMVSQAKITLEHATLTPLKAKKKS